VKALVVGAGGFIGRNLVPRLRANAVDVLSTSSKAGTGLDPVSGALLPDFRLPTRTDVVFYLAASPIHRDAPAGATHIFAVNTLSAIAVAKTAAGAGVKRFVYASTGNVYAPSFGPLQESAPLRRDDWYALSKVHAEEALALFRSKMEVVIARLFGVYGPGQTNRLVPNLVESVRTGRVVTVQRNPCDPVDCGGFRISLCHVDDVAEIMAQLGSEGGPPCLNIASNEVVSVRQIAEMAGVLLGRDPIISTTDTPRTFDLVADTSLLNRTVKHSFISFAEGFKATVRAALEAEA
jgi:nucleoside-diphosphate-sugar epimerase